MSYGTRKTHAICCVGFSWPGHPKANPADRISETVCSSMIVEVAKVPKAIKASWGF